MSNSQDISGCYRQEWVSRTLKCSVHILQIWSVQLFIIKSWSVNNLSLTVSLLFVLTSSIKYTPSAGYRAFIKVNIETCCVSKSSFITISRLQHPKTKSLPAWGHYLDDHSDTLKSTQTFLLFLKMLISSI